MLACIGGRTPNAQMQKIALKLDKLERAGWRHAGGDDGNPSARFRRYGCAARTCRGVSSCPSDFSLVDVVEEASAASSASSATGIM